MNKSDMADPKETARWLEYYRQQGQQILNLDSKSGNEFGKFVPAVRSVLQDKLAVLKEKGIVNKNIRAMVVGIPNVGKSSFINRAVRNKKARVENRPGVTKGNQWFTVNSQLELLDTPGVLWPRFDDPIVAENLALTGAVKDQVLDLQELALKLVERLKISYPLGLSERFSLAHDEIISMPCLAILQQIGQRRGMLVVGGKVDIERSSIMLLEEFRNLKLGRITLEKVS